MPDHTSMFRPKYLVVATGLLFSTIFNAGAQETTAPKFEIFTDNAITGWPLWDCCAGSTPVVVVDDDVHGNVAEFSVLAAPETVQGFYSRATGTPYNAASDDIFSFEMKVTTAAPNGTAWFLKMEASENTSNTGDINLNSSIEGLDPVIGEWQTYTFDIATLENTGLDVSEIDVVMMFPAWGQGSGAVYRVDNVVFSATDSDQDGVADSEDAFPNDPNESLDTDRDLIGNNADDDDDGDRYLDTDEIAAGSDPLNSASLPLDTDGDYISNTTDLDDDNDGVSDIDELTAGSDPLDRNSVPAENLTLMSFDDFDLDGVNDWLTYEVRVSDVSIKVLAGDDANDLASYTVSHNFESAQMHKLADRNDDGISELGIFGFDTELNRYQMIVHNGQNGQQILTYNWPATLENAQLEVLDDLTADGVEEYAINGIHKVNGTRQLVVRNGASRAPYQTFKWPNLWEQTRIVTMSDMTGDGIPEVALYGRHVRIGKGQLFVYDGASAATKVEVYNWNKLWDDIQLFKMDDVDGEGTIDWGQFGTRKDDGRYQWIIKKGHDKRGVIRTFSWPADLENVKPILVADRTGDGVRDVAITGTHKTNGKIFLRINDGKLANQRIANISWPANWEDQQVAELGDLNGDGSNEYAMLGYLKSNRTVQLVIKDGQTLTEHGRFTLEGNWEGLMISSSDVNNDGLDDVLISGVNSAYSKRQYAFVDGTNMQLISLHNNDFDEDGVSNEDDAFFNDPAETLDTDGDRIGNNTDLDDDGDGYLDVDENTTGSDPLDDSSLPLDTDGDFIPDAIDNDDDNDGISDANDACAATSSGSQVDSNGCASENHEISTANNLLVGGDASSKPGFVVYIFDSDTKDAGTSACYGGCANAWPPVLVTDGLASGVSNLGSIERTDGNMQVTHNGLPLYYYVGDNTAGQNNGDSVSGWHSVEASALSRLEPLYNEQTALEPVVSYVRADGVVVTRFGDRGRDRHAKDIGVYGPGNSDHYDHWLAHYWEYRTARVQLEDHVPNGQSLIRATYITEAELSAKEFRVWFYGATTTGQFHFNPTAEYIDRGTWNDDFEKISDEGHQFMYRVDITEQWKKVATFNTDLQVGVNMEFEISQFLLAPPAGARKNYYGTSYVYVIGTPGLSPFEWDRNANDELGSNDGTPIPAKGLLGGDTTLGYNYSEEPAGRFIEMATNLSPGNAQPFVRGRRVHHTNFEDGSHDERLDNPIWTEQIGKAGNHYVNHSCAACHVRNGRALVADPGDDLDRWVFKVADINGNPDPLMGSVLQPAQSVPEGTLEGTSEGTVTLGEWTELGNGLRSPNYIFSEGTPDRFSARIAPQIVGLGLLEAVSEETILEWADPDDSDGDGISGRGAAVEDPVTGDIRLGRFGYKAATFSIEHQVAAALNTDIGVMTSVLPDPDCGSQQDSCGDSGSELADDQLNDLVKYISLLGVGARRDYDNDTGENIFADIGCGDCHRNTMTTSDFHPLNEVRSQTIYPYTDMLLHDMGEGLADNLGEGTASGAEWRTAALWGLGLSRAVTLGDEKANDEVSKERDPGDVNRIGYLHDGRARTIDEAIRWHGGEANNAKVAYENLSDEDKAAILAFLESL